MIYGTFISQEMIKDERDARAVRKYSGRLTSDFMFKHLRNPDNEIMFHGTTVLDINDRWLDARILAYAYKQLSFGTKILVNDSIRLLPYDLKRIMPEPALYLIGPAMDEIRGVKY